MTREAPSRDKLRDMISVYKFWLRPRTRSKDSRKNSLLRWLRSRNKEKKLMSLSRKCPPSRPLLKRNRPRLMKNKLRPMPRKMLLRLWPNSAE